MFNGVCVYVDDNFPMEKAIRKFKKLCEKHGIFDDIKRQEYYMSKSTKRRHKSKEARKRAFREARKSTEPGITPDFI